jgi:hypothetical protein
MCERERERDGSVGEKLQSENKVLQDGFLVANT